MRVVRRLLFALAAVALLAPAAWGEGAVGTFVAKGGLALPGESVLDVTARAALARIGGSGEVVLLRLEAPLLRVTRFEAQYAEVSADPTRVSHRVNATNSSYVLRDAVVTLAAGDHQGWVGMYFPAGGGRLQMESWGTTHVEGNGTIVLNTRASIANEANGPMPSHEEYEWESTDPLLLAYLPGVMSHGSGGRLKVHGPDLRFESQHNVSEFPSGTEVRGDTLRTRTIRWFYLDYPEGNLTLGTSQGIYAAASDATVAWNGVASFTPVQGSLDVGGRIYVAEGEPARVAGDLQAFLEPVPAGAQVRLRVALEGDLVDTTLRPQGAPPAPLGVRPGGWALALVALALAGVAVVVGVRWWVRQRGAPVEPEDRVALAHLAASRERYQEAVEHVREARRQAPTSARLLMEEASYLGALGRVDEALEHYERAAQMDGEGDAEFQAAVLVLQSEGDPALAEGLILRALRKSPILVLEVLYESTGTFDALHGREAFEAAVSRARSALGEGSA